MAQETGNKAQAENKNEMKYYAGDKTLKSSALIPVSCVSCVTASVAQLVEQRVVMREVVSSTPAGPTLLK